MSTRERRDCKRCDGRGQTFEGGDLCDCRYCGGWGVLNAVELGWLDATDAVWSCLICGPHPDSDSVWCASGCGRDYNEMVRIPRSVLGRYT